jgi:hypothetical protein
MKRVEIREISCASFPRVIPALLAEPVNVSSHHEAYLK